MKFDATASRVLASKYLDSAGPFAGGPSALATDRQGNLYIAGKTGGRVFPGTPGYTTPPYPAGCPEDIHSNPTGTNMFVVKLAAADWSPIYSALVEAPCGIHPGPMVVDGTGAAVLGLSAGRGLPLRNPLLAGPTCFLDSSAVAKVSPDGTALQFATYLDDCGIAGIAAGPDGSVYAGVSGGVLRLSIPAPPALSLDQVANAFSDNTSAVARAGLYALTGTGFEFPAIDLGLHPTEPLPLALGGVRVTFDGIPAQIVQTAPGRVIVVAPPADGSRHNGVTPGFTTVQLFANGTVSNEVGMPAAASLPGLLTWFYPNPPAANYVDGVVYNQDGTVNDAKHPAAAGSTVILFATGMGTVPPAVYASWQTYTPGGAAPLAVAPAPGFIPGLFEVHTQVPASVENIGTPLDNGVRRAAVGLQFSLSPSSYIPPVSNSVAVYVK